MHRFATDAVPPALRRVTRSRFTRFTAATVVSGLALGAIVSAGGATAGAATPRAQSVGRFIDGSVGGMPLQSLVDLKDARAKAAPNSKQRNPLSATLLGQVAIPIGNGLKLPGGGVFSVGAANQIAVAKTSQFSYGAAGAVDNTGGAQLTDEKGKFPSDGTINLSGAALGSLPIPGLSSVPGLGSIPGLPTGSPIDAATLGGIDARIGAVQALAQTESGGKILKPQSSLADLQLAIGSPALGALLKQLKSVFKTALLSQLEGLPGVGTLLNGLPGGACGLSPTSVNIAPISLDKGAVVINVNKATITIDLGKLLKVVTGIDIAHLTTSNFDLTKFLVRSLPKILSTGLEGVVTGITTPLEKQFAACTKAIDGLGLLAPVLKTLTDGINTLQKQLVKGLNSLTKPLINASSGGLATLADGLTGVVDIGLNVQSGPNVQPRNQTYKYKTELAKTPDQATNVVKGQSLVRAVEIDLLNAATTGGLPGGGQLPPLPGTNSVSSRQLAGSRAAAAGGQVVSLALANAAAGPSNGPRHPNPTPTTATPTTTAPSTTIPTGVPAGAAGHDDGSSPLVPAALLLLGLVVAAGGVLTLRTRGRFSR